MKGKNSVTERLEVILTNLSTEINKLESTGYTVEIEIRNNSRYSLSDDENCDIQAKVYKPKTVSVRSTFDSQ